tara:strand:+ start:794 stop:970 length:177 start_codon:yes stop_codon:yes gene_type:complete
VEHVIGIVFFIVWTALIVMVMNPALFIRLRYRIDMDDNAPAKVESEQKKDDTKLDRYV